MDVDVDSTALVVVVVFVVTECFNVFQVYFCFDVCDVTASSFR